MPARTFCLPWETLSFQYSHASFVCSIICSPGHEFLGYKTQDWEEWKKSCEPLDCVHCFKAWEYFSARQSRNRQLSFLRCASESNCFLLDLGGGTHATAILLAKWATKSSKQFDRMMEWAASVWICDSYTLVVLVSLLYSKGRCSVGMHLLHIVCLDRGFWLGKLQLVFCVRLSCPISGWEWCTYVLTYVIVWHDPCYM